MPDSSPRVANSFAISVKANASVKDSPQPGHDYTLLDTLMTYVPPDNTAITPGRKKNIQDLTAITLIQNHKTLLHPLALLRYAFNPSIRNAVENGIAALADARENHQDGSIQQFQGQDLEHSQFIKSNQNFPTRSLPMVRQIDRFMADNAYNIDQLSCCKDKVSRTVFLNLITAEAYRSNPHVVQPKPAAMPPI